MKSSKRAPKQWSEAERAAIMQAIDNLPGRFYQNDKARSDSASKKDKSVACSEWWRTYLLVSEETGLPRKAIMRINRDSISRDGNVVVTPTNGAPPLVFRLSRELRAAIANLPGRLPLKYPAGDDAAFAYAWRTILKRAGISAEAARRLSPNSPSNVVVDQPYGEATNSLMQFFEEQYIPLRLRARSARTVTLYRTTIRTFAKFLGREPELSDLTDLKVSRHLMQLRERGLSAHSVEKERCQLLAIWRFACRKGHVKLWPDIPAEAKPERVPLAWTQEELGQLFSAIREETGWIAGVPAADWWTALHMLAWDTGERIRAIMSLRWEWINFGNRTVMVPAEVRKGKRKDRLYMLAPDTVTALLEIRFPKRETVLPWPYVETYLWKRYERILKRAGLPCDRKSKFHRLRRSVASHFEVAGGNATELLGHSTRKVTLEHYLDPRIVKPKQAADLLFRPKPFGDSEQHQLGNEESPSNG